MQYKVGDKVLIRDDLIPDRCYGPLLFVRYMLGYAGRPAEIISIHGSYYNISIDNGCWKWTDEMIAGYEFEEDNSIDEFEFDINMMLGL